MRTLAVAIAGVCLVVPLAARADTAEQLTTKGEQLAKDGHLTEAIDTFKQADRLEPRAKHACLIALAYTRRELWPQAEIFLATCHERATTGDPLPDWVALAEKALAEKLRNAKVAAVEIRVEPATVKAKIVVSSFAPDETFEPRTIHLNQGRHLITATADGHEAVTETVEISNTAHREVVLKFVPKAKTAVEKTEAPPPPPPPPAQRSRIVPWSVMTAGFVVGLAGGAYHLLVYAPARDRLSEAPDQPTYDRLEPDWRRKRVAAIAIYSTGAALIVTGLVLRMTVYRSRPESSVRVSAQPLAGGALLGLEWRR